MSQKQVSKGHENMNNFDFLQNLHKADSDSEIMKEDGIEENEENDELFIEIGEMLKQKNKPQKNVENKEEVRISKQVQWTDLTSLIKTKTSDIQQKMGTLTAQFTSNEKSLQNIKEEVSTIHTNVMLPYFPKEEQNIVVNEPTEVSRKRRKNYEVLKMFICKFCSRGYRTSSAFKHHLKVSHGVAKNKVHFVLKHGSPIVEYSLSEVEEKRVQLQVELERKIEEKRNQAKLCRSFNKEINQ